MIVAMNDAYDRLRAGGIMRVLTDQEPSKKIIVGSERFRALPNWIGVAICVLCLHALYGFSILFLILRVFYSSWNVLVD